MLDVCIPMILKMRKDLAEEKQCLKLDREWFAKGQQDDDHIHVSSIKQRAASLMEHKWKVVKLEEYLGLLDKEVANDKASE